MGLNTYIYKSHPPIVTKKAGNKTEATKKIDR